ADDYGSRQLGGQFGKVVIGLLLKGILQESDGIGLDQIHIIVNQLAGSETVSVHRVSSLHIEAGGSRVQADLYLLTVAADVKCTHYGIQSITGLDQGWGIAALVSHIGGPHAIFALQYLAQ